jgi:hypothetical protein
MKQMKNQKIVGSLPSLGKLSKFRLKKIARVMPSLGKVEKPDVFFLDNRCG